MIKLGKHFLFAVALLLGTLLSLNACSQTPTNSSATGSTGVAAQGLTIYTSFYPMYDFTLKLTGSEDTVINIMPPGAGSHDFEPAASDLVNLYSADVLVYLGAGMEEWLDSIKNTLQEDRADLFFIEAAEGVELLVGEAHAEHGEDEGGHEPEDEDEHGRFDPHVWLSPLRSIELLENIRDGLIEVNPEGSARYQANFEVAKSELLELDKEFRTELSASGLDHFYITHEAFGYLADEYNLVQFGISGMGTEQEPSPERLAELVTAARSEGAKVIFYESGSSSKLADVLAGEIGATVLPLHTIHAPGAEELADGKDYVDLMRENLDNLLAAAP